MKNDIPWILLEKYFGKTSIKTENDLIEKWKSDASENQMIFEQLRTFYIENDYLPVEFIPDTHAALKKLNQLPRNTLKPVISLSSLWYKIAAVFILGIVAWWSYKHTVRNNSNLFAGITTNDTTTLNFTLPDGSKVWLNSSTTLKYPEKFTKNREVNLTGEGYFEVVHDPQHPFIIHTEKASVKVLGTKFNIRSYMNETGTEVAVIEGTVSVGTEEKNLIVVKNESCFYNKKTSSLVKNPKTDPNILAWRSHEFMFDDKMLDEVFECLAKVYHFNFYFESENLKQLKLTSSFSQLTVEEIMEIVSVAANLSIKKENQTWFIQQNK